MIKVSYATMEAMGMLVKRLGQDARRLEKALAETMNASAEWKRIAEEMKKERNALRAATIDTAAGSLLDAFGSLANEPRNGSPDDKYHVRIVTKIHAIKLDRDALRKERDDLRTQLATERERYKQTPCDPPASHDTPAGKEAAHAAAEPKPGDVVRLVREPSHTDIPAMLPWSKAFGMPGDTAIVVIMAVPDKVPSGTIPVRTGMGRCFFWPISCIEIVEDAK